LAGGRGKRRGAMGGVSSANSASIGGAIGREGSIFM